MIVPIQFILVRNIHSIYSQKIPMNRTLIVTTGILFILLMLVMWGYLFMYGAPKQTREVFSNLGIIPTSDTQTTRTVEALAPLQKNESRLSLGAGPLEQITTRAVAGFTFLADEPNTIIYAERGTGHIYEINLTSSLERQISVTTLPQTVNAIFSPNASYVALTVHEGYNKKTTVGTLQKGSDSMSFTDLPYNADNIAFTQDSKIHYTRREAHKTLGYLFDMTSKKETLLFSAPQNDATVNWTDSKAFIAPKPTRFFEGALYEIASGKLIPKTTMLLGLRAFVVGENILYSYIQDKQYVGEAIVGGKIIKQAIVLIANKCTSDTTVGNLWCAAPLTTPSTYLESWYKGEIISEDYLWHVNLISGEATVAGDFPKLAQQTLDVSVLTASHDTSSLLFINKTDQTLWIYRVGK